MTVLQDLITLVRQRSNFENNNFIQDSEITAYINNSLGGLDDLLIMTYDDYKVTNYIAFLQDGYNLIPLPPDFQKLRAVDYNPQNLQPNANGWYTLNSFQMPERNRFNNAVQNVISPWGKVTLSYRVMGNNIMIAPQDEASGYYQIWYTPKFAMLVNTTDPLPMYMDTQGWIEFAVVDTCIKIFNKDNLDPSGFMAERQELKDRILSAAKNRDAAGPKRVANVRFMNDFWPNNYGGW